MAYHGRRYRGSRNDMALLLHMINVLKAAKRRGEWSYAHSSLLVGLVLSFVGLIGFIGMVLLTLMGIIPKTVSPVPPLAIGFIGGILSLLSLAVINWRK